MAGPRPLTAVDKAPTEMSHPIDRREFLLATGTGVFASGAVTFGAMTFGDAAIGLAHADAPQQRTICVFTKPFNSLTYDELAGKIAKLGFGGIEATVRAGGNVEPEQVEEQLPRLVAALGQHGLEVTTMASDINDPNDPLTARVLRTAAKLGIRRYRMKYFRYDPNKSVAQQFGEWRPRLRDLAAMNRELGIQGLYQNHSGSDRLGAALWDLDRVLDDIPPEEIGVAYDIRHATVEGGLSWPTTFRMIRPRVGMVYVKDFRWNGRKPENVPLGEGRVDPRFFKLLAASGFTGPISLHEEYLDHRQSELVPQHLAAIERDRTVLLEWLRG